MMEEEEKKEGMVRDLIEKKRRGEMTSKEIIQEIYRRGLQHNRYPNRSRAWILGIAMIGGGILCYISVIAKITHLSMLEPITELPAISFPSIIRYSAVIFILLSIIIMLYTGYLRGKKGRNWFKRRE